jgi:hypothetical protein
MAKRRSIADGYLEDLLTQAGSELDEPLLEQTAVRRAAKPKRSPTTHEEGAERDLELDKPRIQNTARRRVRPKRRPTKAEKATKTRTRARSSQRRPGRRSPWGDASVVLGARQVDFIDMLARTVRACGGRSVDRSDVLCALVDALDEGRIDFSRVSSVPAVKRAVRDRLSPPSLFQLPQAAVEASIKALIPIAEAMLELMIQRGRSSTRR